MSDTTPHIEQARVLREQAMSAEAQSRTFYAAMRQALLDGAEAEGYGFAVKAAERLGVTPDHVRHLLAQARNERGDDE